MSIIDTGKTSALKNMEIDADLLKNLEHSHEPVLRFFEFESDSATYGHFIQPFSHLNERQVKKKNLQIAKRPTGGGVIFHLWDFTFSLAIPASHPAYSRNPLDNYTFVNSRISQILTRLCSRIPSLVKNKTGSHPFCMAGPTLYDVMLNGKKVGGAAQRCTKFGFLHQGSIALMPPVEEYLKDLLLDAQVIDQMRMNSSSLAPEGVSREMLKNYFTEKFQQLVS